MTKCKDCIYFGDIWYKSNILHICDNTEKSGYSCCRDTADGCAEFKPNSMKYYLDQVMEIVDQQRKYQEKELAWIITHYDFIVGSIECKNRLMEILPDKANIICSKYVEDPTTVYVVKKFDIKDLIKYEGVLNFGDQDTLMPAT